MILKSLQDSNLQRKARITAPVTEQEKAEIEAIISYRASLDINTNVGELIRQALFIAVNPKSNSFIKAPDQSQIDDIINNQSSNQQE